MIVTKIEPITKTKFKIYIDEEFAFVLYKGELSKNHIKEQEEIEEVLYDKIKKEIILKRGKLRAMHLLSQMDRSETQLRHKLKQNYYTEDIIDAVMDYVKSFGYINDREYARRYIENKKQIKSKKEIGLLLFQKGIAKEQIDEAFQLYWENESEIEAIRVILRKKNFNIEVATDAEKQKLSGQLARKGFRYEDIRQVIQVSAWNA
ncbi:MAG: RecX family transcriptional regulator [Lachnospiraceae bacterium]